jgi:hypothetical protein
MFETTRKGPGYFLMEVNLHKTVFDVPPTRIPVNPEFRVYEGEITLSYHIHGDLEFIEVLWGPLRISEGVTGLLNFVKSFQQYFLATGEDFYILSLNGSSYEWIDSKVNAISPSPYSSFRSDGV